MNRQNHIHMILTLELNQNIANGYDGKKWEKLLDDIVIAIDMKKLAPPQSYYCGEDGNEGWTFFQIIETSHISGHYWENTGLLQMDIYSCKHFEMNDVTDILDKHFPHFKYLLLPKIMDRNPPSPNK